VIRLTGTYFLLAEPRPGRRSTSHELYERCVSLTVAASGPLSHSMGILRIARTEATAGIETRDEGFESSIAERRFRGIGPEVASRYVIRSS